MSLISSEQCNENYALVAPYMKMVRDSITGEPALKSSENDKLYLPAPICESSDAAESAVRYKKYLASAEYDEIPSTTLETLLGAACRQPNDYSELPDSMGYIIDDADGDGLSLDEHIKITQSELLQMKFCGLLAEYSDLAGMGVGDEQLTRAQVKALGLRSSIKHYPRNTILNWEFRRVNGVKQLSWILLREEETVRSEETFACETVYTYLILALDEAGNYYQKKATDGSQSWSEAFYPETPTGTFDYIPFEFAIQGDYPKGELPKGLGYILPITTKSLHRYNISAAMKESGEYSSSPITVTSGWSAARFDLFKKMNGNKEYLSVAPGSHWTLPEGVEADKISFEYGEDYFSTYLDRNAKEIRAVGGAFNIDFEGQEQTATATIVNAAERLSVLSTMQSGIEKTYNRLLYSCAKFEGIELDAKITLNREFVGVKMQPQERDAVRNDYLQGLISRSEALRQLEAGGVLTREAKEILNELELSGV